MPRRYPERKAAYDVAYHALHREEIAAKKAAYYAEHRSERIAYNAARREEKAAYNAAYEASHRAERVVRVAAHRDAYPERASARSAVQHEVAMNRFPPANTMVCEVCDEALAAHWHHHNGYGPEHKIDVIAVCRQCHVAAHRK